MRETPINFRVLIVTSSPTLLDPLRLLGPRLFGKDTQRSRRPSRIAVLLDPNGPSMGLCAVT